MTESAHIVTAPKVNKVNNLKRKNKEAVKVPEQKKQIISEVQDRKCYFCGNVGHMKKECNKYRAWVAKKDTKGTFLNLVCSEINLASVPRNTWWVDSGAATYISVSM